jgi:acyl-CoA synthetase (AMP-forming)/AMP-acid ligase II
MIMAGETPTSSRIDPRVNPLPGQPRTVLDALARAARSDRGITFLELSGAVQTLTYAELFDDAQRVAARLRERGHQPKERIILDLIPSLDFLRSFFGSLAAGLVPVPIYPASRLERLTEYRLFFESIRRNCQASGLLLDETVASLLELSNRDGADRITLTSEFPDCHAHGWEQNVSPNDLCFLQYTSGTTATPKAVMVSHANVLANVQMIGQGSALTGADVVVSWLPPYHDMGLVGTIIFSVYHNLALVLMAPLSFLARPLRWLEAISQYRGTMSPAPNFAYSLCARKIRDEEVKRLDLSSWRLAMNGSEPVQLSTITAFSARFQPAGYQPEVMQPVYGLAEATLAVAFAGVHAPLFTEWLDVSQLFRRGRVRPLAAANRSGLAPFVAVGRPLPGLTLKLIDSDGAEQNEGEVGEIVVQGPSIAAGYFGDPTETARTFRAGWLHTGDMGYLSAGQLFILGRQKELIVVRGRKYPPSVIESALVGIDGLRRGKAVAFSVPSETDGSEKLVVAAEVSPHPPKEAEVMLETMQRQIARQTGLQLDEAKLLPAGSLPRTSSGKLRRNLAREYYLNQSWPRPNLRERIGAGFMQLRFQLGIARKWLAARLSNLK